MPTMIEKPERPDSGAIAVYVLLAGVVLVMAMAGILRSARTSSDEVRETVDKEQAFYTAEAGIEAAITDLLAGGNGGLGAPDRPIPFLRGSFWVRSETLTAGEIRLTATSALGTLRRRVEAVIRVHRGSGAPAVFLGSGSAKHPFVLDGWGDRADRVVGGVYTAGDLLLDGDATCDGPVVAGGRIDGMNGLAHRTLVDPDFTTFPTTSAVAVSVKGDAKTPDWVNEALLRNPDDREEFWQLTPGDDFFVDAARLRVPPTPEGIDGWLIRVPGNLWFASPHAEELVIRGRDGQGYRLTFVAEGSVFIADDVRLENRGSSALGLVALAQGGGDGSIIFCSPDVEDRAPRFVQAHLAAEDRILGVTWPPDASLTIQGTVTALEGIELGGGAEFTLRVQGPQGKAALPPALPHGTILATYEILSWRETTPGGVR